MVKGKDSYFIGKSPLAEETHHSNEIEDLTNDSFLEFLDGIDTPPKIDPSPNLQPTVEGSFSSSLVEIISKLVENSISLTNLLQIEKNFNKELTEQICSLKYRIQSLETHIIEIKLCMSKKHVEPTKNSIPDHQDNVTRDNRTNKTTDTN